MEQIPVKKYRVKRFFRSISRAVVPWQFRARKVIRKWRRRDRPDWPPRDEGDGLQCYEYSLLSQNGEDGIIRHVFDRIGFESRYFVEFGFGAAQCNALRLMLHEGFRGLMIDGSTEQCNYFNYAARKLGIPGVTAVQAFIDLDNLEALINGNGIPREIDFLSVDVNGNDYWFWEKLECVSPRLACIEYNAGIGPELSWTIPYAADFERYAAHPSGFFAGASLAALEALGKRKGYRLIGCDSTGTNAFFLRSDIDAPELPTRTAGEAFRPHANWLGRGIPEDRQLKIMRSLPYIEV